MRPSAGSARSRHRRLAAGFGLLATLTLAGCPSEPRNKPTKVEDPKAFNRPEQQVKPRDTKGPIGDPALDPPLGRDGAQVGKAEIDAILAAAAELGKIGNTIEERIELSKCANKTPASARCDGAMGLSLAPAKNRRAVAHYYLIEASKLDDPDAGAPLYAAVAEALRSHGLIVEATQAQEKAVVRDGSAIQRFALGRLLSLQAERLRDAAELIAGARAEDDKLEWLYEEAVVRGQIPTREDAKLAGDLLEAYVARVAALPEGDPAKIDTTALAGRIAELRGLEKVYPTREEYEAMKAAQPVQPPPAAESPNPQPIPAPGPVEPAPAKPPA
ncbi:hypothetical protein ACNOYE_23265 [Nannocystaceae bacterium ST9]